MTEGPEVITVTLNPAIDWTLEVSGFASGQVNRVDADWRSAGGKGINVAARLAMAGHDVAATGVLGQCNDQLFTELFADLGIVDACVRSAADTRTNIKIVVPDSHEVTDLNQVGGALTEASLTALERVLFEAPPARWYVLAGSLPPGAPSDLYARWIPRLQQRGAQVAVDASGSALRAAVAAGPDLIKPNHHELAELTDECASEPSDQVRLARRLTADGVGAVAVSLGAQGALLVTPQTVLHARPGPVSVRTTVGAGDAMVAGLVAGHLQHLKPSENLCQATAWSMAAVSAVGLSRPQPEVLAAFFNSVQVQDLSAAFADTAQAAAVPSDRSACVNDTPNPDNKKFAKQRGRHHG